MATLAMLHGHRIDSKAHTIDVTEEVACCAEVLAQPAPVQEPVAWISHNAGLYHFKPDESLDPLPLYLAPPAAQRPWTGLTDWEISQLWFGTSPYFNEEDFAHAIEAKLKEKNT